MNFDGRIALSSTRSPSASFSDVDTWVFDLDNTLYAADADLWPRIDQRITLFLMALQGNDGISARALQKYYYQRYGTTLRGLMSEHGIDPRDFLKFAHDIDRSQLPADPDLSDAIGKLPGRKFILTNGSREHAEATATKLGLLHHFEDIFDIVSGDYIPKPEAATYQRFFDQHGIDPEKSAMFEDLEKNLKPAREFGMRTVLVVPKFGQNDHREAWEKVLTPPAYVDFMTDNLSGFLSGLVRPNE